MILLSTCTGNEEYASETSPPNIIFLLLDDVSAIEFNFYNGPGINTPTIDQMADDGLVFSTAYSQPICAPSRATLLTGKYAFKTKYYNNKALLEVPIHSKHYTLGEAMKDAGYETGWFGKQHIDRDMNPSKFGFDYYAVVKNWEGYDGPSQGRTNRQGMYGVEWYWHPAILVNGVGVPTTSDDFGPKIVLDSLKSFVSSERKEPFFAYWPTNLPHHEYNPDNKTWVRPDVPEYDEHGRWTGKRIKGTMKSNLEFIDFALQELIEKLNETSQLENTIIFITGDNGTANYGKAKRKSEIAIHVPFIAYGSKLMQKKGMSDVLVDFTDLLPTFLDLAGYSTPKTEAMDGQSFASYLLGKPFEPREWISAQLDSSIWLRTRHWLLDGNEELWYAGSEFDERKFEKVISKRKELKNLIKVISSSSEGQVENAK